MISFKNFQIFIEKRFERNSIDIFIIESLATGERVLNLDGNNIIVSEFSHETIHSPDDPIKPFLSLPMFFADMFLDSIYEYVLKDKFHRKTENENLLEGKLTATEKHLVDMQEIAKKLIDSCLINNTPKS